MDSCICSEGIRFLEAAQVAPGPSRETRFSAALARAYPVSVRPPRHDRQRADRESFPPEVRHRLGWYVYRLIDPRNGETFQARVSAQLGSAQHSPNLVSTPYASTREIPARSATRDPSRSSLCRHFVSFERVAC
jgi:hypothetical protein